MILESVTLAVSVVAAAAALMSVRYARIARRLNRETARIRAEGDRIRGQRVKTGPPPSMPVPPPPPAPRIELRGIDLIDSPLLDWIRREIRRNVRDAPH